MEEKEKLIWWKWTKRIVASLGILIVLFIGVSVLVIKLYEEEIKRFAIQKINDNLTVEVEVKAIDLTLIDQFPMASLRFTEVFIADKLSDSKKDTMIAVEYLYLNLNFMDLIGGKYDIKDIKATNTISYLKVNNKGQDNFSIWKEDTTAKDSQFSFDLEKVRFKNLDFNYDNKIEKQKIELYTKDLRLTGRFSDVNYQLKTKGELFIREFTNDKVNYLTKKNAKLDLEITINTDAQSYTIKKGELDLEDLSFAIDGKYVSSAKGNSKIDLNLKGKNISFISVFSVFPNEFLIPLKKYDSKGLLNFKATIKGEIGKDASPKIEADFSLEQGALTEKENNISLKNLSFNGYFSNQNKEINSLLTLKNIKGELSNGGGSFTGKLTLKDFENLHIESSVNANLNLAVLNEFLAIETIKSLDGNATVNYQLNGQFVSNQFKISHSAGNITFTGVNLATTLNNLTYENLSGKGVLTQNDLVIPNLEGVIGGSALEGNATLVGLVPYLINPEQKVWIDANIKAKKFDLLTVIQQLKTDEENVSDVNDTLSLPKQFQVNLNTTINELNYGNFKAKNLTAVLRLKDQHLSAENITFKTSGGNVLFNSEIDQTADNHFLWTGSSKLENIDIQDFFTSVDNFGQTFLTDQHLKGKASLILDFGMLFSPDLTLLKPSIVVNATTKITNGMLINHPTLNELANYLDGNKLVNRFVDTKKLLTKIDKIKFSELNNSIEIKNGNIYIPKTSIQSNVLDIDISGEHSFENDIDYHFSFGLRDVLITNKNAEDFGPIQDDGLGKVIFLRVFGNLSNLQYELDKTEKKANRQEIRAEEKQNFRSVLKEEFGLFKKDSTLKSNKRNTSEPQFEIEDWEEEDNETEEDPLEKEEKKKKEKSTPKWLKKLGVEDKKETKKEMSVDFNED